MKYIVPESKLDKIIFKYLDINLKGLEKREPKYYEGIILTYPDQKYGMLGYGNNGDLYIYGEFLDEISYSFGMDIYDTKSLIGRWVSDRFQLEVKNTWDASIAHDFKLTIDTINEGRMVDTFLKSLGLKKDSNINKLDKIVFKYLDIVLKGLEKRKAEHFEGIVLEYPNDAYGILGYDKNSILYIYNKLIDEISNGFGLKETDTEYLIGRWVSDRFQLEVKNTFPKSNYALR